MCKPDELIWITWEEHRRSRELAAALGASLFRMLWQGNYLVKTFFLSFRTIRLLLRLRPRRVIVQNPSMALASLVCFLKPLFRFKVIVDRHSNFKFESRYSAKPKYWLFHYLSRYTIRKADLTIVTNEFLSGIVEKWGGRGFVLQDKLPELPYSECRPPQLAGKHNITYICSFSDDEPVDEVLGAARLIDKSVVIYVTGNPNRYLRDVRNVVPENVVFTGFLSEEDYQSLLGACDAIMALTRREHLLLCGAYEAVALGKPLILSDTACLRGYFREGALFTWNSSCDIAKTMGDFVKKRAVLANRIPLLQRSLRARWPVRFAEVASLIRAL